MSSIWIHTGRLIDPFSIEKFTFTAEDFIRPLAMLNRYTGHTYRPLSVAEHTVKLSLAPQVIEAGLERAAVLHDFNEALTNDLPHPFKRKLPDYCAFEERVQRHLFNLFEEPWENMERLKEFDRRICQDEMQQALTYPFDLGLEPLGVKVNLWHWEVAEVMLSVRCAQVGVH